MWIDEKDLQKQLSDKEAAVRRELHAEHQLEVKRLQQDKELALKEKEFEIRHFKDDENKKLTTTLAERDTTIAVLRKENEMLGKITDLNADIIDVKDLVSKLIGKLPEINLSSLTINGSGK
jgi:hypothetical protein